MSVSAAAAPEIAVERTAPPQRGTRRRWTSFILPVYSRLVIVYLLIPVAFMIMYSFNRVIARGKPEIDFAWHGFTWQWYKEWNGIPGLVPAFFVSIRLAVASTALATVLGTLLALSLVRYRYRGKGVVEQVLFANIAAPEIVLGASMLGFFIQANLPRGFLTLLIAHVMFSIAYVAITVRARLSGYDLNVEWAAQDLGATPWVTFWKVTLPLIYPGVMAGALLAFALSIDDFVTSSFVNGSTTTFPLWVYGAVRVGTPPQVFVLGTFIFTVGAAIAVISLLRGSKPVSTGVQTGARTVAEEAG